MGLELTHRKFVKQETKKILPTTNPSIDLSSALREFLKPHIGNKYNLRQTFHESFIWFLVETIRNCDGNLAKASRLLGEKRTTVIELLKKAGCFDGVRDKNKNFFDKA